MLCQLLVPDESREVLPSVPILDVVVNIVFLVVSRKLHDHRIHIVLNAERGGLSAVLVARTLAMLRHVVVVDEHETLGELLLLQAEDDVTIQLAST